METLASALPALAGEGLALRAVSRFFSTPCFPAGAGPDYINAVVAVDTLQPADQVLGALHRIEAEFSRVRDQRWGMRTLDLDLIAAGGQVLPDHAAFEAWQGLPLEAQMQQAPGELVLPHPRLQDRAFVLVPMCDVAADWRHPVLNRTAAELLAALPQEDVAAVVPV
jgi:2-amino-4-hydroxy-6-hydroxymethyldihydropteridine diphosphokinase